MLKGPKYFWDRHQSTFIKLFGHYEGNWLRKRLCYWYLNSFHSVKTMASDDKYYPCNICNLLELYQMQLSKILKTYWQFFPPFFKSAPNFHYFQKTLLSQPMFFLNYRLWKTWLDECLDSPVTQLSSILQFKV